jgi:hypothetical protein
MTADRWPSDAEMDALLAAAAQTKSHALRFDPEAPGGFRVLTAEEDNELIDAIRLPAQRYEEAREHLTHERDDAQRDGNREGVDTSRAHLDVLDEEQRRDERYDPALPSREELDAVDIAQLTEPEARAWEYLDARRDLTDEREQALAGGDMERVAGLDGERAVLDSAYVATAESEVDDEERER